MRTTLALALLALGCGGSTADDKPVTDSAVTDASSEASSDAPGDAGADATCDVGAVPTAAPITHEFIFVDPDAGASEPKPTGGDAKGEWVFKKLTMYLTESARSAIDVDKSSVTGSGFAGYTASEFRVALDFKIKLETTVVGTVDRELMTRAKGTYATEGNELVYTATCVQTTSESQTKRVGWTRVDATHALMFIPPQAGPSASFVKALVAELEIK